MFKKTKKLFTFVAVAFKNEKLTDLNPTAKAFSNANFGEFVNLFSDVAVTGEMAVQAYIVGSLTGIDYYPQQHIN